VGRDEGDQRADVAEGPGPLHLVIVVFCFGRRCVHGVLSSLIVGVRFSNRPSDDVDPMIPPLATATRSAKRIPAALVITRGYDRKSGLVCQGRFYR